MRFLDLFAGIGGFRLGMEAAGHECVGYVEWDKFARKSYEVIHDTEGEWTAHDITRVTDNDLRFLRGQGIDVICGGFPCQAFSVAGKRGGFHDTRGTLFFEIARFAEQIKPRLLFLENVKGLLSHDKGQTFATILNTLDELGYDAEWQVLNSKDFGVPQNRERVFIVGHSRAYSRREVFPIGEENGNVIKQIIAGRQGDSVATSDGIARCLVSQQGGLGGTSGLYAVPVLTPDRSEKRQNGRRFKEDGEPMFTITAQDRHGVLVSQKTGVRETERANTLDANYFKGLGNNQERTGIKEGFRIRKLTPRECWRLQGFPDWAFDKATEVNSDSQLYKQAGNSVSVPVIYEIAKQLGGNEE